jgi:uncharacterized protein (UPF0332 family)
LAFLDKAVQALESAENEYINHRYDNCANRCYYACFQAAIYALQQNGVRAGRGKWGHDFVPAQFEGHLLNRRHVYSGDLRGMLERLCALRTRADYQ